MGVLWRVGKFLLETSILFCLSLISWEYFNLFFRWIKYFYFVWFIPRQFVLFGCCCSWESFSFIILSNQVVFCTMLLKYDYSLISTSSLQGKGNLNFGSTVAELVTTIIWNFVFNLGRKICRSINNLFFKNQH